MVQSLPMPFPQLDGVNIRAFSSLSRRDVAAVEATVRAAAQRHAVQEHDDYDGYLSILITPTDVARPSFMVAGKTGAIDLAELWGDDMVAIGTFPSIGAAMIVLRPALERVQHQRSERPAAAASVFHARHGDDAPLQAALDADAKPGQQNWSSILRALDDRCEGG